MSLPLCCCCASPTENFGTAEMALSDGSGVDALNLLSYGGISLRTDSDGVIKRESESWAENDTTMASKREARVDKDGNP